MQLSSKVLQRCAIKIVLNSHFSLSFSAPCYYFFFLNKPVHFSSSFTFDPTQPVPFVRYGLCATTFQSSKSKGQSVVTSIERESLGDSAAFASYEGHRSHCTKISSSGHVPPLWYWAVSQSLGNRWGRQEWGRVSFWLELQCMVSRIRFPHVKTRTELFASFLVVVDQTVLLG